MKKIAFNRNLALLLSGQFISQVGDKFYAIALAWWVLQETHSPAMMGVMLFASMAPSVILGFFVGSAVDRWNRKAILVAADVARGVVVSAVVLLYGLGVLGMAGIVAAQALLSAASAFFNPAALAVVPQIVPEEGLGRANAKSQLLYGASGILGPVLGGLAVSLCGYAFVFAFNALSFFASAALEAFLRVPARKEDASAQRPARERLSEGYRYILSNRKILVILCVVAIVHFFVGSVQVLMPVLANSLSGDGARNLGYIEAAFGAGVVATALLLNALNLKKREETGMFGGIGALGAVMAAMGAMQIFGLSAPLPFMGGFFLFSAAVIVISTNYTVILQRNVDNAMAGRVFGVTGSVGNFFLPVSTLVFGYALNYVSAGIVAAACGAVTLLIGATLLLAYKAKSMAAQEVAGIQAVTPIPDQAKPPQ